MSSPCSKAPSKPAAPGTPSRGDRRTPVKSASTASLPQQNDRKKLSAVLEMPNTAARRKGASREDGGESKIRCDDDLANSRPSLAKSQSTTTAGLGSSSSGSCAITVASMTPNTAPRVVAPLWATGSDASSDRYGQQQVTMATRPRSLLAPSGAKSTGTVEPIDLADSDASRMDAKRDLVWQLELERLRNATLKLEVQREICEGSDLRKRLCLTEAATSPSLRALPLCSLAGSATASTWLVQSSSPTISVVPSVPVSRLGSMASQRSFYQVSPTASVELEMDPAMTSARMLPRNVQQLTTTGSFQVLPGCESVLAGSPPHCLEASLQMSSSVQTLSSQRSLHCFTPRHRIGSVGSSVGSCLQGAFSP